MIKAGSKLGVSESDPKRRKTQLGDGDQNGYGLSLKSTSKKQHRMKALTLVETDPSYH